jgi:hypothetical protein
VSRRCLQEEAPLGGASVLSTRRRARIVPALRALVVAHAAVEVAEECNIATSGAHVAEVGIKGG